MSLTVLGNVINALVDAKSTHIPYRESKLTRLLQNSLGGNAKTVMCANCGPADYNYDETLSTLRYANRAKNIKNKPKINEDPKDAMLREYQEQIQLLKAQLAATARGVMIDENGKEVQVHNAKKEIVEKIVEREVIKEVKVGVSEKEMEEIRRKATEEKEFLMKQAQQDMKALIDQQSRTAQERYELQAALDREAQDRKKLQDQQSDLVTKLKSMEEKLIKGGEVISKASKQEALLRKAEQELQERRQQESALARELAEKEEQNLQLEEHFSSLQEEVEVKTKKLKKLWGKYQAAVRETTDLQEEFQRERGDLLETVRQLTTTLKLKEVVIANFIPDDIAKSIEKRATYNEEDDTWVIPKMDLSGNALRATINRPLSNGKLRRPETDFARQRKQYDNNPRYKYDNILNMDLDGSEKTTQEFSGPGMKSRVEPIISMDINDNDGEEVTFDNIQPISSPYLSYGNNNPDAGDDRSIRPSGDKPRPKTGKKRESKPSTSTADSSSNNYYSGNSSAGQPSSSSASATTSSRPKSASRRRESEAQSSSSSTANYRADDYNNSKSSRYTNDEDLYPTARGLIKK